MIDWSQQRAPVFPDDFQWSYQGVVEYGFPGTALHSYQCGACYEKTLTAAAPMVPMSTPPRTAPAPGTKCSTCGCAIEPTPPLALG